MSRTFTKLFSSITESTVWCEPDRTRLVWIAMLAMADHAGRVWSSVPGLANRARVPLEDVEIALTTFLSPDAYSRTPDHEGRRIEPIDGGWRLLNHAKYRQIRDEESIKESKRRYINERRAAEKVGSVEKCRTESNAVDRRRANAEADTEAEVINQKATVRPSAAPSRFMDFWSVYPNKKGKKDAERHWKREGCDAVADQIIGHVQLMLASDDGWRRGYVPMGSTYVNGRRWDDQPKGAPLAEGQAPAQAATMEYGAEAAIRPTETKEERQRAYEAHQRALGLLP